VLDQELRRGRLGEHDGADSLRLLAEETSQLREREDDVAMVAHRRRRRDAERRAAREDVDRLARHLAVCRQVCRLQPPAKELAQRRRVDDSSGEQVRARLLALLEHCDRHLAEPLAHAGVLLE
jgi:hypothetical protein